MNRAILFLFSLVLLAYYVFTKILVPEPIARPQNLGIQKPKKSAVPANSENKIDGKVRPLIKTVKEVISKPKEDSADVPNVKEIKPENAEAFLHNIKQLSNRDKPTTAEVKTDSKSQEKGKSREVKGCERMCQQAENFRKSKIPMLLQRLKDCGCP